MMRVRQVTKCQKMDVAKADASSRREAHVPRKYAKVLVAGRENAFRREEVFNVHIAFSSSAMLKLHPVAGSKL
jgi:hypothetical protein